MLFSLLLCILEGFRTIQYLFSHRSLSMSCAFHQNWSDVLYVNVYGCDYYPTAYNNPIENTTDQNTIYKKRVEGDMFYLPICGDPRRIPGPAYALFLTFIIIAAYIIMHLVFAAVTTGEYSVHAVGGGGEGQGSEVREQKRLTVILNKGGAVCVVPQLWFLTSASADVRGARPM